MRRREYQPGMEIDRAVLVGFTAAFVQRRDCYPLQQADGSYVAVKKPLTFERVEGHLQGKYTLGAYCLDGRSHCRWMCFDADDETEWRGLLQLAQDLEQQGVTSYRELSRRGGHVWLFLSPALSGREARRLGKWLLRQQG